ncbi:MAG: hypothetical protein C4520_13545 [Candidatus Abyssobacteria bacterium SURF_5]|uniref:Uncharacterized protein n=1 Tax=Abyssobacteria bacterium (strain SURF_5) TaxID=2093360 RepID=A0A3A4NPD0_ABYX5|nr:MAG: hypothetical protein C4520_13545 [Candidatus Abyssubacteria bacterium SURF_5]
MVAKRIICPLCGDEVSVDRFQAHFEAEKYVLDRISKEHPEWKESDGSCTKCLKYYRSLTKE